MGRLKSVLKKLFFLPPLPTVLIAVPSFLLVFILLSIGDRSLLSYLAYLLSAYAMIITITGITGVVEAARNGWDGLPLIKKLRSTPLGGRLLGGCRLPFGNHTARRPVCQPFVCGAEPVFRHPVPVRVVCRSCVLLCPVVGYARRACTIHPPQAGGQKYRVRVSALSRLRHYPAVDEPGAGRHCRLYGDTEQRVFLSGVFDLWDGAVYVLYHHFSDCQRDQIPEARQPCDVGDQGRQSDGCAGFHAFAGNRHARSVWERRTRSSAA